MFYKIPLNSDLSNIAYRCMDIVDDYIYIEYLEGEILDSWINIDENSIRSMFPNWFETVIELTQLDRIENAISISNEELRQEGADALTEALINSGIL